MKDTFVSIIVPTYSRFNLFIKCLHSLSDQDYNKINYEIIAVHDGVDCDYDENLIRLFAQQIKNFRFEKISHRGVALVRNYGISLAKGELILMLDDDCEAKNNWITAFVKFMKNHPAVAGAGGTIFSSTPKTFIQKYIDFKRLLRKPVRDAEGNILALITANACFRKSVLEKINGFRQEFTYSGGEDLDLSYRAKNFGELTYCETAVIYHHHRNSLLELIRQHIHYGRGVYRASQLNKIPLDSKSPSFYKPTLLNIIKYIAYIFKKVFMSSPAEFNQKNLKLSLYFPYCVLDLVRKFSFLGGIIWEHYFFRQIKQ